MLTTDMQDFLRFYDEMCTAFAQKPRAEFWERMTAKSADFRGCHPDSAPWLVAMALHFKTTKAGGAKK